MVLKELKYNILSKIALGSKKSYYQNKFHDLRNKRRMRRDAVIELLKNDSILGNKINNINLKVSQLDIYAKELTNLRELFTQTHNQYTLLNDIIIKQQNQILEQIDTFAHQIIDYVAKLQKIRALHEKTFAGYQGKYDGQDLYLIGTGPSVKYFKSISSQNDGIYIGLNKAFNLPDITLDYIFMQDYIATKQYMEDSLEYKNKDLVRFYAYIWPEIVENITIPRSVVQHHNAKAFYSSCTMMSNNLLQNKDIFALDLESEVLCASGGIAFPAMQFALYTQPKRLFIVGCDCGGGYADSSLSTNDVIDKSHQEMVYNWKLLKQFADKYYPNTQIVCINPVGLKGLFDEVYTPSFLEANENIDVSSAMVIK